MNDKQYKDVHIELCWVEQYGQVHDSGWLLSHFNEGWELKSSSHSTDEQGKRWLTLVWVLPKSELERMG